MSKEHSFERKKKNMKQLTESKDVYGNQVSRDNFSFKKGEQNEIVAHSPKAAKFKNDNDDDREEVKKAFPKQNKSEFNNLEADIDDSDFEMPARAIQCRMKKITKVKGNKRVKTIRRVFKMEDGTEEVHEDVIVDRI